MTIVKELDALHVNGEEYKFPAGEGDMKYSDFSLVTKSGATVTLDLFSEIEPAENFTVNAPSEIKEGQMYILRVTTGATPYTMTLGTGITNPYSELTLLTANTVHQFGFLAVDGNLELQPSVTQSGGGTWGSITGTLSDQTDLNTALNAKANASDVNTKTFEVEELTVSELQPVMDFYANGGYPIIYYSDSGTEYPRRRGYYTLAYPPSSSTALFMGGMGNANTYATPGTGQSTTTSCISISLSNGTVTSASFQNSNFINYLSTSKTNDQYTPTNNYDPATKKYVDDIKPTSGSTAPSTTPTYVGQQYVDTTNDKLYVATGTTSSSDWTEVGSGGGGGNVIAMTQQEYNALSTAEKNDGKLRIITDAPTEDISVDWDNVANKKVDLSTQTGNLSELKFWIGTTATYQKLDSYDNNTVYICKKVIS